MGELALGHAAEDLHVAVAARAEPSAGCHPGLVDDEQVAPASVRGVVVAGEREAVRRLQPAVIGTAAVLGASQGGTSGVGATAGLKGEIVRTDGRLLASPGWSSRPCGIPAAGACRLAGPARPPGFRLLTMRSNVRARVAGSAKRTKIATLPSKAASANP